MLYGSWMLAAIIDSDNGAREFVKLDPAPELFKGPEIELFKFVKAHVQKHGTVPARETVKKHMPEVSLPTDTPEPPSYYHDQMRKRHRHINFSSRTYSISSPVQMVWTSMTEFCTEDEIEYVRELKFKRAAGTLGLVYVGDNENKPILERMSAVAAACIRNKINAQVMMVNDAIRETQTGTMPMPTVLLIPNFYIGADNDIPKWRSGALLDMLYTRQQEELQTFIYVQDMNGLGNDYGESFVSHLIRFDKIPA